MDEKIEHIRKRYTSLKYDAFEIIGVEKSFIDDNLVIVVIKFNAPALMWETIIENVRNVLEEINLYYSVQTRWATNEILLQEIERIESAKRKYT